MTPPPALARAAFLAAIVPALIGSAGIGVGHGATASSRLAPFFDRLQSNGRAEVRIEQRPLDPEQGTLRGRVRLEPPDRVRLDFEGGESVTLRSDGGEWIQPKLKQLVRLDRERARDALLWWDLLLGRDRAQFVERTLRDGRILIVRRTEEPASDSAWVSLDAARLPSRLEVRESGGVRAVLELRGWRFARAHGEPEFKLSAPAGFEVVELP
ncbi:MAG TPA: hypothetical protein VL123_03590 [Candidatus Udaeobacter sp.]|jgi:outer membrane lipoprotein-sorting protein|nr:hypothetical protein [Candidatus Udaeobacter sp.]